MIPCSAARDAAKSYDARGLCCMRVPYRSKNPGRAGWQHERLTRDALLVSFPDGPSNVGLLLGEPSRGLVDVDLDGPEARRLGDAVLPRTGALFGRPSSPRSHRLYLVKTPPKTTKFRDPTITRDDDERAMLLELRSTGAHTLVPPSIHPGGEEIAWEEDGEPAEVAAEVLLAACGRLAAMSLLARHWPGMGSRHDAALALVGGLLRAGWDADNVTDLVRLVAEAAGDEEVDDRVAAARDTAAALAKGTPATGWPSLSELVDERVVGKVRDWLGITGRSDDDGAHTKGAQADEPWTAPVPLDAGERPAFPADVLPPVLRRFATALATATQTPLALPAMILLAVLAAAAAARVVVRVRPGWLEPVNLFLAVALDPANRKSAVFRACAAPLVAFEREDAKRAGPDVAVRRSERHVTEKRLKTLTARAAEPKLTDAERGEVLVEVARLSRELAATPEPELPVLVVDDCSPEKLAKLLSANGGRLALLSPEGGLFGMIGGRYTKSGEANQDVYLKGHAGDPIRVDRVGRPPDHVPDPALTIGLAVQPAVIAKLAERPEFRQRGLPARFLFAVPHSTVGRRQSSPPPVPDITTAAYVDCVTKILHLPASVDDDGVPLPQELVLDAEAGTLVVAFQERLEPRLGAGGDLAHIADWAGKLVGAACRMMGLLHVAEVAAAVPPCRHRDGKPDHWPADELRPWDTEITVDTARAAIHLAEAFLVPHAMVAFASMGAHPALADARLLLGWLQRGGVGTFSVRDAHQELRRHQLTPPRVERAAGVLVEHGYVRPIEPTQKQVGRPASPRFAVNPMWDRNTAQNAQNTQNPENEPQAGGSEAFEDYVQASENERDGGWDPGGDPGEEVEDDCTNSRDEIWESWEEAL